MGLGSVSPAFRAVHSRLWRWLPTSAALAEDERRLAEKSHLLQATLDLVGHGIEMIDDAGRTVVINRQAIEPRIHPIAPPPTTAAESLPGYQQRRPDGRIFEVRNVALSGGGVLRGAGLFFSHPRPAQDVPAMLSEIN